jgi:hypothetical protein
MLLQLRIIQTISLIPMLLAYFDICFEDIDSEK